jgi:anti-sigma B factor antagonist
MAFELRRETQGAAILLRVSGDVDLNATPGLLKSMKSAFKAGKREVIMDLDQVNHMDSSGIAALVEGVRDSKKTGVEFLLARVPENVLGVLDLAKLRDFFRYQDP